MISQTNLRPSIQSANSDASTDFVSNDLVWSVSIDTMLARWCDQAKCFEWMHAQASTMFGRRGLGLSIISNSLTAVAGVSNVIAGNNTVHGVPLSWIFGGLSVMISISNMLQEKLAYAKRCAEHQQASLQWGVIRRKIEEEVSFPYHSRKNCSAFLKLIREDINRATTDVGNGQIPEWIRQECFNRFSIIAEFDVPDICGQMEHTKIYVEPNFETSALHAELRTPLLSSINSSHVS